MRANWNNYQVSLLHSIYRPTLNASNTTKAKIRTLMEPVTTVLGEIKIRTKEVGQLEVVETTIINLYVKCVGRLGIQLPTTTSSMTRTTWDPHQLLLTQISPLLTTQYLT